jgi:transposase
MAELDRKTKRYPSDLTDEEWGRIEPLLPQPSRRGRKPKADLREVLNAIRYVARSAGGWRMLPVHFGPWQTVYWWFRRFVRRLLFRTIHDVALMLDREAAGREASPTGGVLDSQTVKAPFAEVRGYDGGKRIVGRKRHVAVDTDGRLLMVNLTPADVSDSAGAQTILDTVRKRWPWLKHLFADAGDDRTKLMDKAALLGDLTGCGNSRLWVWFFWVVRGLGRVWREDALGFWRRSAGKMARLGGFWQRLGGRRQQLR